MPDVAELTRMALDTMRRIDAGVQSLADQSKAEAEAERTYRHARAQAWVRLDRDGTTAAQREDAVNASTSDARYARDVARGGAAAAREALRARRAELSMVQTLLGIERAEAELMRYGPEVGP